METRIIEINKKHIDRNLILEAGKIIQKGGLVAFPTETVYGLGADGLNEEAVKKIYQAKGRPIDNPLILHISSMEDIYPLVKEISNLAYKIIDKFWPGPLTIVLKKSNIVPQIITAGLDTVAIRMPNHPIAQEFISQAKRPIAAPSANISGRPSPTLAKHVIEDMEGKIDMIIDGGKTGIGLESTVLDLSGKKPMILRPGGVTYEDLKTISSNIGEDKSIIGVDIVPKSPGQKYRHYAPKAEMLLFTGKRDDLIKEINKRTRDLTKDGRKVGIMATRETKNAYKNGIIKISGSRENKETIASNLFQVIREFDESNVDIILAEGVDFDNIGMAIMNRMIKAAGGRLINL